MIARLLISPQLEVRIKKIQEILGQEKLSLPHPDILYFPDDQKLGVAEAKMIRAHLSLKPYSAQGRAVVLESAHNLTQEAQNALLKTLEEPPENTILLLGSSLQHSLLPTILSRCQIDYLNKGVDNHSNLLKFFEDIGGLQAASLEKRFEYIERLGDKEEFLKVLVTYFRDKLKKESTNLEYIKSLMEAEGWVSQNVNIRAVLEYLMLKLPD